MNLLILTTTFPISRNDYTTPRFVYDLSLHLSQRGYNIVVLTPDRPNSLDKDEKITDFFLIHRFRYYVKKKQSLTTGEGIIPIIKKSKKSIFLIPFLVFKQFFMTRKMIEKYQIDIINSHWLVPSGLIGAIFQKFTKKKNFVTIHAAGLHLLEKIPFGKAIARFIFKNSIKILVVSNYGKVRFLNLISKTDKDSFNKKVKVIPMGADIKMFDNPNLKIPFEKNSFNVMFIGRLVEKKGLKYAINAFNQIKDKNIYFHICGSGPLKDELINLTDKLDLNDKVKFYGKISEEDKIKFLNSTDILLVPSIETKQGDKEGLPVVILEALSVGLPVIATNVGGIKDGVINNQTGLLIKQKNIDEIKNAILLLKNNKNLLEKFRANCIEHAANFKWKNIAERYDFEIRESFIKNQ